MSEKIPASRVPFLDKTGLISREWYRFFNDLFNITGSAGNNISLLDLQTAPVYKEPAKSRREVLPISITVGASPFYYRNNNDIEIDAMVINGTVSEVLYSRDGITFYNIALRAMCRLSPNDWIGVVYTSIPELIIIPR